MNILQDVALSQHSAMRLGGRAAYLTEVVSRADIEEAIKWARQRQLPVLMIGNGNNIVWRDAGFSGLVLINKIMGYQYVEGLANSYTIVVGSGEKWDSVVERAVAVGASGIECLSLIPGTAGATPVQNVGAYGQEISQTLISLEAYDQRLQQFVTIPNSGCDFGYRTSRFNTVDHGRFFIISITLGLRITNPQPPFYSSLQRYLYEHGISKFTPKIIRDVVIAIRTSKLPDPAHVANSGSFFANPLVSQAKLAELTTRYPHIAQWHSDDGRVKLSAAWLIEQAGFKDIHDEQTGMATWPMQPLVLVNEHAKSTADLMNFKQKIVEAVKTKFGVTLEQEPELLPDTTSFA